MRKETNNKMLVFAPDKVSSVMVGSRPRPRVGTWDRQTWAVDADQYILHVSGSAMSYVTSNSFTSSLDISAARIYVRMARLTNTCCDVSVNVWSEIFCRDSLHAETVYLTWSKAPCHPFICFNSWVPQNIMIRQTQLSISSGDRT